MPQFILKNFRRDRLGKVYFAEKGTTGIRLKPVKDIFFQDHGERILAKPPKLKQEGAIATLESEPEWTEFAGDALQNNEDKWARALRGLIAWSNGFDDSQPIPQGGAIEVKRGPDKQEEWVEQVADYCLRTMFRSEEIGHELWDKVQENEDEDLEKLIEDQLGKKLPASKELRELVRQHNRSQTRTGVLVDQRGIFDRHNLEMTIAIWRITDGSRFIIGSRGGCWVEHQGIRVFMFPVDPKIAVNLLSRKEANRIFGTNIQLGNPRVVIAHNIPGRTGITAWIVNKTMWSVCDSVAGCQRMDIEYAQRS